jgi:hypothetical protein
MPSTIITKNGSGAPLDTDLVAGELAVDLTNGRLYTTDLDSGGTVIEIGLNPSGNVDITGTVTADGLTVDGGSANNDSGAIAGKFNANGNEHIRLEISTDSTIGNQAALDLVSNSNTSRIYTTGSTGLKFSTDGGTTAHAVIDGSGNVGISASSPSSYHAPADNLVIGSSGDNGLTIASGTSSGGTICFADGTSGGAQYAGFIDYQHNGDYMRFGTNVGTERMRIDASGNVGIGTTPEAWTAFTPVLRIKNTATGGGGALAGTSADNFRMFANTYYDGVYKRLATGFATQYGQESGAHVWSYAASGAADSTFTWSEAMRIDASGLVGIGSSTMSSYNTNFNDLVVDGGTSTGVTVVSGITGDGTIAFADGTAGDEAYRGFVQYSHAGDILVFGTSGAERMRIDSGGSVLIGKSTPTDLHNTWNHLIIGEKGAIISENGAGGIDGITLADNVYIDADTGSYAYQTTAAASQITQSGGDIAFSNAASGSAGAALTPVERMRIDASGNLSLNSNGSIAALDNVSGMQIGNSTASSAGLALETLNSGYLMYVSGTSLKFWDSTDNTDRMTLDGDGNVGIGITPKTTNATVTGSLNVNQAGLLVRNSNQAYFASNIYWDALDQLKSYAAGYGLASLFIPSDGSHRFYNTTAAATGADQNLTLNETMRIDSSGNLLAGTDNSSASVDEGIKLRSGFADKGVALVSTQSTNVAEGFTMWSTGANAWRFYVGWDGKINATSNTIQAISDQRFKENIRDLDDGLLKVMELRPRKFDWKEGKGADIKDARGFIAQEFEEVFPDLVGEWKDKAPEGEEPYKAVSQDLIPTLVKAIQEQQATIEALTVRIAALES